MRSLTAYSSFLPKPKQAEGWTVSQTWWFVIIATVGLWVAIAAIIRWVLS